MDKDTKTLIHAGMVGTVLFLFSVAAILFILLLSGCSASATSEITPAKSDAAQKSVRVTPESSKRSRTTITIKMPDADVEADTSEDK